MNRIQLLFILLLFGLFVTVSWGTSSTDDADFSTTESCTGVSCSDCGTAKCDESTQYCKDENSNLCATKCGTNNCESNQAVCDNNNNCAINCGTATCVESTQYCKDGNSNLCATKCGTNNCESNQAVCDNNNNCAINCGTAKCRESTQYCKDANSNICATKCGTNNCESNHAVCDNNNNCAISCLSASDCDDIDKKPFCGDGNFCTEVNECSGSSNCPTNLAQCHKTKCVECVSDDHCENVDGKPFCGDDNKCSDGKKCEFDNDCPTQTHLCEDDDGICVKKCTSNSDCPTTKPVCEYYTKKCINKCSVDNDCPMDNYYCDYFDKVCLPSCSTSKDCKTGQYCDETAKKCIYKCYLHQECREQIKEKPVCGTNGECTKSCTEDSQCPNGQICDYNNNICTTGEYWKCRGEFQFINGRCVCPEDTHFLDKNDCKKKCMISNCYGTKSVCDRESWECTCPESTHTKDKGECIKKCTSTSCKSDPKNPICNRKTGLCECPSSTHTTDINGKCVDKCEKDGNTCGTENMKCDEETKKCKCATGYPALEPGHCEDCTETGCQKWNGKYICDKSSKICMCPTETHVLDNKDKCIQKCKSNDDCLGQIKTPVCNVATGKCECPKDTHEQSTTGYCVDVCDKKNDAAECGSRNMECQNKKCICKKSYKGTKYYPNICNPEKECSKNEIYEKGKCICKYPYSYFGSKCLLDLCQNEEKKCEDYKTCITKETERWCYCDPNTGRFPLKKDKNSKDLCVKDLCLYHSCGKDGYCSMVDEEMKCNCKSGSVEKNKICVSSKCKKDCETPRICSEKSGECICPTKHVIAKDGKCVYDYCKDKSCDNNGNCSMETIGEFSCKCTEGYTGDTCKCKDWCADTEQNKCDRETTECVTTCESYYCKCKNSSHIYDVNEKRCYGKNDCLHGKKCESAFDECINGSCICKEKYNLGYKCGDCITSPCGHVTCESEKSNNCSCKYNYEEIVMGGEVMCVESKKSCALPDTNCEQLCELHGQCSCFKGFTWNATGYQCDVDQTVQIKHNLTCPKNAVITFDELNNPICLCKRGYTMVDNECQDIDECKLKRYKCKMLEMCENTDGGFKCVCNNNISKWNGNTEKCEDKNECNNPSICPINAYCENTIGGYNCPCKLGYRKSESGYCIKICSEKYCESSGKVCNPITSECVCRPGYELSNCNKIYDGSSYFGHLKLNWELNNDKGLIGDFTFNKFQSELETTMKNIFVNKRITVTILNLQKGSTDVTYALTFDSPTNKSDLNLLLKNSFSIDETSGRGNLGIFSLLEPKSMVMEISNDWCTLKSKNLCSEETSNGCKVVNGYIECECKKGFKSVGGGCIDINECDAETHDCSKDKPCTNIEGGYVCRKCPKYYIENNNGDCIEICKDNPCENGKCSSDNDGIDFRCSCSEGYGGTRCEVEIMEKSAGMGLLSGLIIFAVLFVICLLILARIFYKKKKKNQFYDDSNARRGTSQNYPSGSVGVINNGYREP